MKIGAVVKALSILKKSVSTNVCTRIGLVDLGRNGWLIFGVVLAFLLLLMFFLPNKRNAFKVFNV